MRSKTNVFFLFLSFSLLALGLTTTVKPTKVFIWKISILASEYGHWFAVVILFIGLVRIYPLMRNAFGRIQILILLVSFLIFLKPTIQARYYSHTWENDLKSSLGIVHERPLVSITELFWERKEPAVKPQEYIFSSGLNLDFYRANSTAPSPWVIVVHGGGWDGGDKSEFSDFNFHLVHQGVSVAAISYRLAPQYKWPAQRDDVLSAVSYLKANATQLNIDPERWVIMGRSAGGQIAQAVAYQIPDSSLKGVIAFYSPSDLEFAYRNTTDHDIINSRTLLSNLLGGSPDQVPDVYTDASPLNFISRQSPPTLLLHGRPDPLTWFKHSRRLMDKIKIVGANGAYIELPWATHAFDFNLNGPGGQIARKSVDGFLSTVFNKS